MQSETNEQLAIEFISALQNRTFFADLARFYHEDIEQIEFPNAVVKNTAIRNLNDLKQGAEKGKKLLQKEVYEVIRSFVSGNTVIIEAVWTGTLAIPFGNIPVGGQMKAYFAQ